MTIYKMSPLKVFADRIEKLAFEMQAPNPYTPRFVEIANAMRTLAMIQVQHPAAPATGTHPGAT